MAQMPFSPCDQPTPADCTDVSVHMLADIFGDTIWSLVQGASPDTVQASSNMLATLFSIFNSGVLIVGALIVSYVAAMGTINTANDGEAMGKNWSSIWTPVRIVMGGAVLLPTTSGYSFIQLIVLMIALWGVGLANSTYRAGMALGVINPDGLVDGVQAAGATYGLREFASSYLSAAYCARLANDLYPGAMVRAPDAADAAVIPNVAACQPQANVCDRVVVHENGEKDIIFEVKDRNPVTNLGGGSPFCGSISLSTFSAPNVPSDDPTDAAMATLKEYLQAAKITVVVGSLMPQLQQWIATWPTDINSPGWDTVDTNVFNNIVNTAEQQLITQMAAVIDGQQNNVETSVTDFFDGLTASGWAASGGFFQRLGVLRGQFSDVMAESPGSVAEALPSALPDDARADLLEESLTTAIEVILERASDQPSNVNTLRRLSIDAQNIFPKSVTDGLSVATVQEKIDHEMSSYVNAIMQDVVEVATGANAQGNDSDLCGSGGVMGGAINRMKCMGDYLALANAGLAAFDAFAKTVLTGLKILAAGIPLDAPTTVANALWSLWIDLFSDVIGTICAYLKPLAFYFGVFLPSVPYTIMMMVVVGWAVGVMQSVIASTLWAVMHMTPERSFVGSQTQGYLLLLGLFARPVLAVLGLFAAIVISDPIIDFAADQFFSMRGAIVASGGFVGAVAELVTFFWWIFLFASVLLPIMYIAFSLPQTLPDHVLKWINAGVGDLGEGRASAHVQGAAGGIAARINGPSGGPGGPGGRLNGPGSGGPQNGRQLPGNGRNNTGSRQVLSANPAGVEPATASAEGGAVPSARRDTRTGRQKVGQALGVAAGRATVGVGRALAGSVSSTAGAVLTAGRSGVEAYQEGKGSVGNRVRKGVTTAGAVGAAGIASTAKATGSEVVSASRSAASLGKEAYGKGADSAIDTYRKEISGNGQTGEKSEETSNSDSEILSVSNSSEPSEEGAVERDKE